MTFDFEIEGTKHSLYFGMVATQIVAERSLSMVDSPDNIKAFAYIVHGGLCNQADRQDRQRPLFETSYDLAIEIIEQGDELQTQLYNAWAETKPAKKMLDLLPSKKKAVKKPTGTK